MIKFAGIDGFKREMPKILNTREWPFPEGEARWAELAAKVTGRVMEIVEDTSSLVKERGGFGPGHDNRTSTQDDHRGHAQLG